MSGVRYSRVSISYDYYWMCDRCLKLLPDHENTFSHTLNHQLLNDGMWYVKADTDYIDCLICGVSIQNNTAWLNLHKKFHEKCLP